VFHGPAGRVDTGLGTLADAVTRRCLIPAKIVALECQPSGPGGSRSRLTPYLASCSAKPCVGELLLGEFGAGAVVFGAGRAEPGEHCGDVRLHRRVIGQPERGEISALWDSTRPLAVACPAGRDVGTRPIESVPNQPGLRRAGSMPLAGPVRPPRQAAPHHRASRQVRGGGRPGARRQRHREPREHYGRVHRPAFGSYAGAMAGEVYSFPPQTLPAPPPGRPPGF
jgi:hypothetical protein